MSIFSVGPDDTETFTVSTNPHRHFTTSSAGSTGAVYVFARRSSIEKEIAPVSSFVDTTHDDADLASLLASVQKQGDLVVNGVSGNDSLYDDLSRSFYKMVDGYMNAVNAQSVSQRKHKSIDVVRFTPPVNFAPNTLKKLIIKEQLSPYYRTDYPSAHWAYTNYNSLNFFTSSTVPGTSALLYPNIDAGEFHEGYVSGTYTPSGSFSFDFYINPRYRQVDERSAFYAGTILHLSSTYALSLVQGSGRDHNGLLTGYRLLLQLSHSADIRPSVAKSGTYPSDLVFLSEDNSLTWNNWHHVVVRWGTSDTCDGTGSFNIDGIDRGVFVVPSSTIAPKLLAEGSEPSVLSIGNYYEGSNFGNSAQSLFFAADPTYRDGLEQLDTTSNVDAPTTYKFQHPLNAELHDLSIRRLYETDADIKNNAHVGPAKLDDTYALYVPPFFVESCSMKRYVNDHGGIMQTPFFETDGTTNDPFNVALAFGVNGHYINIENFLKDFANNTFPRLHHMTGATIDYTTDAREANSFLYDQPYVRRRNSLLLPCDDGTFVPGFDLLSGEKLSNAVDDLKIKNLSLISLDNLLMTSSLLFAVDFDGSKVYETLSDSLIGATPESPGAAPGGAYLSYMKRLDDAIKDGSFDPGLQEGAPLTIYQRTRDPSSNQVTFFDVCNLYYGKRIMPGSVVLSDSSLSGSGGAIKVTLRDDGRGTLYRSDSSTGTATWNSVGTVFYDEGIIVIKSPHLYFFGKEGFDLTFKGEQNVHVLTFNVTAPANLLNSSSNPCYKNVPPSAWPNDPDKEFVYITGINFHDDNLNIVMKAALAQPIMKRTGDRISFSVKLDM